MCATNLLVALDAASLRRFALKIEFRPMRADQRRAMFGRLAAGADARVLAKVDRLEGLTPGDFAAASRQARLVGTEGDGEALVAMLEREIALRRRGPARAIGFA